MNYFPTQSTYKKDVPTSTPNNAISSRRSIHQDTSFSPIKKRASKHSDGNLSKSLSSSEDSLTESSDSEEDRCENHRQETHLHEHFTINLSVIIPLVAVAVVIFIVYFSIAQPSQLIGEVLTIDDVRNNFPTQSEYIWEALRSGIEEVKRFNKPSVFLLLYKDELTINKLLRDISKYAVCILHESCDHVQPIVLTSLELNTEKAIEDYGFIIDKYTTDLERRGVMIVKDLNKISGMVAQAFHSMCDEITPLVARTLYFFTIQIEDSLSLNDKRDFEVVEELLKAQWGELDDDIFYPLLTRISSIVLRIVPEKD